MLLYQNLALTIHKKCQYKKYKKMPYKNNELKILALTWNEEFQLPDGSYSVLGIQNYSEYI